MSLNMALRSVGVSASLVDPGNAARMRFSDEKWHAKLKMRAAISLLEIPAPKESMHCKHGSVKQQVITDSTN